MVEDIKSKKVSEPTPDDPTRQEAMKEAYKRGRLEGLEQLGASDIASGHIRSTRALAGRAKTTEERASYYNGILKQAYNMGSTDTMVLMSDVTNSPQAKREKYADEVRGRLKAPKIKVIRVKGETTKVDVEKLQALVDRAYGEGIEHGIDGSLMVAKRLEEQAGIIEEMKKAGTLPTEEKNPDTKMT